MKDKNKKEIMRIIIISILIFICFLLTIYFHAILNFEAVYTHFFYIPIILAALWWKKRGMIVSVILSLFLIISHFLSNGNFGVYNDFFRVVFFIIISYTAALLSERIKQAEDHFREMFNHMSSGVVVYETIDEADDFIIKDFNKASERIDKVNKNDVIGKRVTEVFPGVKDFGLFDVFRRVWKTGTPEQYPVAHYKDNRIDGWRENYVYKLSSGDIVTIYDDVTERKQAEDKLRLERNRLVSVFEAMSDGVYVVNKNHDIEYVNPLLIKVYGPYESRKCYEYFQDREDVCPWCKNDEVFAGKTVRWEWYSSKNKKTYDLIDTPLNNSDGSISKLMIFRDITERKQAIDALRESEEKHRLLAVNTVDCIWQMNMNLEFTYINRAIFPYLGFTPEEFIGSKLTDHCSPEEAEKIQVIISDALANLPDNTGISFETIIYHKNGEEVPGEIKGKVLLDDAGNPIGLQGITRDISERKKAEEERKKLEDQFVQAQKMESVGRLAGGIAHDFNNLLTVIMGNTELALMSISSQDNLYEEINEIKESAERAAELTRQILAFSRRQIIELRVTNLNKTLLRMDKMLRRIIGEDIELVTFPGETPWNVMVDPGQIEQVLTNLAVNSRDAMPEGGKLTIETANVFLDEEYVNTHAGVQPGNYVMMAVSDTGIGMNDEVKSHIFEPFYTTKEQGKGTGLGLATCYGIVKQSYGNIWVYSEPGKGTTVKIYFPKDGEQQEDTKEIHEEADIPKGTETVLVVEDEPSLSRMVLRTLRSYGYSVLEAANGEEAIRVTEKYDGDIHLVLSDVVMPIMGGKELTGKLKEKYPNIKIIFMSGYTDNSIVHHGILEHGLAFIQKPFSPSAIARKVRQVLDE